MGPPLPKYSPKSHIIRPPVKPILSSHNIPLNVITPAPMSKQARTWFDKRAAPLKAMPLNERLPFLKRVRDYLFKSGVAPTTNKKQQRYDNYYKQCLTQIGVPIQYTQDNLELYTAWRWLNSTVKSSSLNQELSNIKQVATLQGQSIPPTLSNQVRSKRINKGFSITRGPLDDPRVYNEPLTYKQYCNVIDVCAMLAITRPVYHLYRAMIALAVWGMLRSSEYTMNKELRYWQYRILNFGDVVDIKNPPNGVPMLRFTLKVTKIGQRLSITDPEYAYVSCQCSANVSQHYCPYCIFKSFATLHIPWNNPTTAGSPILVGPQGTPVTYKDWLSRIKDIIHWSGLPRRNYGTHCLRRTGATLLYNAGVQPIHIKTLGRWSSIAWLIYIRPDPKESAASVPALLNNFIANGCISLIKSIDTNCYS